jgi:hypothetical protein
MMMLAPNQAPYSSTLARMAPIPSCFEENGRVVWQSESQLATQGQLADKEKSITPKKIDWKRLGLAGLFLLSGLTMKGLPAIHNPQYAIPTDWKLYGKVLMGVLAAGQVNQAFHVKLPPWLSALETVGFIFPLTTPNITRASLAQLAVLAPWVAGTVQGASSVGKLLGNKLEDWHIPKPITKLVISTAFMIGGVRYFPAVYKRIAETGILNPISKEALAGAVGASTLATATCVRGCTPGGVICLSEVGEMLGGMSASWKADKSGLARQQNQTQS